MFKRTLLQWNNWWCAFGPYSQSSVPLRVFPILARQLFEFLIACQMIKMNLQRYSQDYRLPLPKQARPNLSWRDLFPWRSQAVMLAFQRQWRCLHLSRETFHRATAHAPSYVVHSHLSKMGNILQTTFSKSFVEAITWHRTGDKHCFTQWWPKFHDAALHHMPQDDSTVTS